MQAHDHTMGFTDFGKAMERKREPNSNKVLPSSHSADCTAPDQFRWYVLPAERNENGVFLLQCLFHIVPFERFLWFFFVIVPALCLAQKDTLSVTITKSEVRPISGLQLAWLTMTHPQCLDALMTWWRNMTDLRGTHKACGQRRNAFWNANDVGLTKDGRARATAHSCYRLLQYSVLQTFEGSGLYQHITHHTTS